MTVEHEVAGEDHRAILRARTLTELEIAEPGDWERSPSKYVLSTLKRWIALHSGDAIREQFALDATLSNTPDRCASDDIDRDLLYLTVEPDSAGYIVIGPTLETLEREVSAINRPIH